MADGASSDITLYVALISAGSALLGTVGGGLISFLTTYHLKKKEWQQGQVIKEIEKREKLYADFMAQCAHTILKKLDTSGDLAENFSMLSSLVAQVQLHATERVSQAGEQLAQKVLDLAKIETRKSTTSEKGYDHFHNKFCAACRDELRNLRKSGKIPH